MRNQIRMHFKRIQLQVLLRARAVETQCFVLAAAQVGRHHEKRSSYGHALAVDPWGVVLGDCGGEEPGLVLVEIDLEKVRSTRRNMPVQQHRRDTGFYHTLEKNVIQLSWGTGSLDDGSSSATLDTFTSSPLAKLIHVCGRFDYENRTRHLS